MPLFRCAQTSSAVFHVADDSKSSPVTRDLVFTALEKTMPGGNVAEFNDTHTHAEVLAKFDEAIATL